MSDYHKEFNKTNRVLIAFTKSNDINYDHV